ncbi:MAG: LL-diaminopimelate aminotransferase [Clostridiales bacterium]|jgi:LL-diaminopimelate aminotransferase|nr:LL-diaminopimelate aminotransferase [Clostridiales bacterium]
MEINKNYLNLKDSYLFRTIAQKVNEYKSAHPERDVIRLGIGDVTLPLAPEIVAAMSGAVAEMGRKETFRGYDDTNGYGFLKQALRGYYAQKSVELSDAEIFVGDGAKSDIGNILDIFGEENAVVVPDPVYPVYADTNIMAGRKVTYINGNAGNNFLPLPDKDTRADIIYLCSPNNPTGAVYDRRSLGRWVDYALDAGAVILFDAAYEAYVSDPALPTSIYQIEGAKKCAVEICSFSKTAGFTGVRCGYTVVPAELVRGGVSLNKLWGRRQSTKFNGVSYITQRGAAAALSSQGLGQIKESIRYYMENARVIAETLRELGLWFTGGENSPYIWLRCPNGMSSWEFFDYLLNNANVVGTPGSGFGANGEGFFRLTAFGDAENLREAAERIKILLR